MTDMSLNWDDALRADEEMGDGGFNPIPKGPYIVRVLEAEAKTFSTGNPGIKLKVAVVGGPFADRLLWTNLVWNASNPQSLGMFSKKVQAFGLTREWLAAANPSLQAIAKELLGRMASADVEVSEYQGKATNDVKRLNPIAGAVPGAPVPVPTPGVPTAPPVAPVAPMAPPVAPTPPVAPPVAPVAPPVPVEPIAPVAPPAPQAAPAAPVAPPVPTVDSMDEEPF